MNLLKLLPPGFRDALHTCRSVVNKLTGFDIEPYKISHPIARRQMLFEKHNIDTVIDGGANRGQFAMQIRRAGFRGNIHSFEPLKSEYLSMQKSAKGDSKWTCYNMALGAEDGTADINVSNLSVSSSLLQMTPAHHTPDFDTSYIRTEKVTVRSIDSVFPDITSIGRSVFLKLDVQGFEYEVLRGAVNALPHIEFVQAELSFVVLYDGEKTFSDFVRYMESLGFTIVYVEQAFTDSSTCFALQCDVIFHRPRP